MSIANLIGALRHVVLLLLVTSAGLSIDIVRAESATAARGAAQLEQLVAPIALYPDALLSQVLMASTYPLEVVEAARWSQSNPRVSGQALEDAMERESWDPSVKALTAVPQTLQMMNDKLDWTQELGDAFLAQQQGVLDAVQRLRARADANGHLTTNEHQRVEKVARAQPAAPAVAAASTPAPIYTIAPVNPEQYHVPVYDPAVVYGAWPYPDYAPFYWTPPGYAAGGALAFTAAAITGAAIWGGVDWWRNRVNVNVNNFNRFNRTNIGNNVWSHNPAHRGGVPYRDQGVAQRFGDPGKAAARDAYRGKADAGRRELAKPGGVNRAQQGAAGRPAAKQGNAKAAAQPRQAGAAKQGAAAKKAAQPKQAARAKQAAQPRQAARSKPAAQQRSQARPSTPRPQAGQGARARGPANVGARPAAARHAGGMQGRPAGMRGGGMARGGGRGRR